MRPRAARPGGPSSRAVVAGAVAALVLALVVFAGGTEATITGALLLGFGFGWALMAALTARRTRQPQRWAVVPAVAMGATGLALVVLTPGNQTMTALNWVWPPLMLALAVWMFVQMRRSVTGKARWVLTPVVAVLVARLGRRHLREHRGASATRRTYAAPGKLYDVGGHRLHLDCRGQGSPTVVLSNGLGEVSAVVGADHRRPSPRPPGSAPTTAPARAGATTPPAPRTASSRPRTCTPSSPRPASTARTCWSGTPPAAPTR